MILEFDQWVGDKPYPNLAKHTAVPYTPEWRQFSRHWPFSEPPNLHEFCQDEGLTLNGRPAYIVSVGFFDFNVQWFNLIPANQQQRMQAGELDLLFTYIEGDHPGRIREHLLEQCNRAGVPESSLLLITGNSIADTLPNSAWFPDHEMIFRKRNRQQVPCKYHENPRPRLFTALVRTHKWWRATIMADFWRKDWHKLGYFGYNPTIATGESEDENPIEVDRWTGLRDSMHEFVKHRFFADKLTADQHNDHHLCVQDHFEKSYLNVVIETLMDVDQSGGVFLTEKTFKPIKNAQPFVIFGPANSLARLRDLGYRTFDHVLDNRYDSIENTTERYECLMYMLDNLFAYGHSSMHQLYCACRYDILHNQQHFLASKADRLNNLLGKFK